ncbi:MAG: DEAD/DEAH box helicase [Corynebacterium sp.]|nr:DEAD/DEAH box helicase [Corynebacterium sp.]
MRLWIEDTATRKTVDNGAVLADIPIPSISQLASRSFKQRVRLGKKNTGLFTTALTPNSAAEFLERLLYDLSYGWSNDLDDDSTFTSDFSDELACPYIAPDLQWMLHLWEGIRAFAAMGRVVLFLDQADGQMWPSIQPSHGAEEELWIMQMSNAAPGILHTQFGAEDGEISRVARAAAIGLSTAWFRHKLRGFEPQTAFSRALLNGDPFEANLLAQQAIKDWGDSLSRVAMSLVVVIAEAQEGLWKPKVNIKVGDASPVEPDTLVLSPALKNQVDGLINQTTDIAPILGDEDTWLNPEQMLTFVEEFVPELEAHGFSVMLPRAWTIQKVEVAVVPGAVVKKQPKLGFEKIVDFNWRISIGGHVLSDFEMEELIRSRGGLVHLASGWVRASKAAIARAKSYLEQYTKNISLKTLRRIQLADPDLKILGDSFAASVLNGTMSPIPMKIEMPPSLHAELRPYQQRGVEWLHWMYENELGALLADDMGLGKTVQVIAFMLYEIEQDKLKGISTPPNLVVSPATVVMNWADELQKFAPDLRVGIYHGNHKDAFDTDGDLNYDVVLTSYNTFLSNPRLMSYDWNMVIADEAQKIKNPSSKTRRAICDIPARYHLAMTGTPVENTLVDLWSIMDFINPGAFGTVREFRHRYRDYGAEELRTMVGPFMIRREKSNPELLPELPDKHEILLEVPMTPEQAALYAAVVREADKKFVMNLIYQTKAICDHPAAYLHDGSQMTLAGRHRSGKVEKLLEILDKAVAEDKRVLIFTQIIEFGQMLQDYLSDYLGEQIDFLYGAVPQKQRRAMISRFQNEGPHAMIISSLAGGVGINLTAASIVVHMDRWWNPAVENQATDRAYRIGQKENVTVYKMITQGSIEESINDILTGKVALANDTVPIGEGWITQLEPDELRRLFKVPEAVED